jgi:hypothetical protein
MPIYGLPHQTIVDVNVHLVYNHALLSLSIHVRVIMTAMNRHR